MRICVASRAKNGTAIDIEVSAFAVRDDTGHPVGYVGVKRDITEREANGAGLTGHMRSFRATGCRTH